MTVEDDASSAQAADAAAGRQVRASLTDGVGHVVLDRPDALNALDGGMVRTLDAVLAEWEADRALRRVVLESSSPRAFCAGGDIRAVRERTLSGDELSNEAFFRDEYRLDRRIAEFPRPHISLIQGACMGGGLGLSVHGSHRVVTESAVLAMPETGIGFLPDVGATWFLPRLPGGIGLYLGLTGARSTAADALYCGLATHLVPAERLPDLRAALLDPGPDVDDVLGELATWPSGGRVRPGLDDPVWREVSPLAEQREAIDACFGAGTPRDVLRRLEERGDDWSAGVLATLRGSSPMSLHLTAALLRTPTASLESALARELAVVLALIRTHDFAEGVRAALVDRDRSPRWSHASVEEIPDGDVERWLAAALAA